MTNVDDIPSFHYLDTAKSAEYTPAEDSAAVDRTFVMDDDYESPASSPHRSPKLPTNKNNNSFRHHLDVSEGSSDFAEVNIHNHDTTTSSNIAGIVDGNGVDHNVASYDPKLDSSCRCCWVYFRVLLGVACTLVFFIILIVLLTMLAQSEPEQPPTTDQGLYGTDPPLMTGAAAAAASSSKNFVPPPTNISAVCTAQHIVTQQGFAECLQVCRHGSCCQFPSTIPELSCLRGHEQECQMYHHYCEAPPSGNHNNAPQTATTNSNNSANSSKAFDFVPPPDSLSQLCSIDHVATQQGFHDCVEVCKPSVCCRMADAGHPDLDCQAQHAGQCQVYHDHCRSIVGIRGHSNNSTTTTSSPNAMSGNTYVTNVCSDHSLATLEGWETCSAVCHKQECCWKSGMVCPLDQQHGQCQAYSHCLALEASDHFSSSIKESLEQTCSDQSLQTIQGHKDCLTACSQASCCFGKHAGECPQQEDSFCNQYTTACAKVQDDLLPPAPLTLHDDCSEKSLATLEGVGKCEEACVRAPCCWANYVDAFDKGKGSCADTNPLCQEYQPCQVLHDHHQQQTAAVVTTNGGGPPPAPATLSTDCSANNLQTLLGLKQCDEDCAAAKCCWTNDTAASCATTHAEICQQYTKCHQLQDPSSHLNSKMDPAPASIMDDCTTKSVSTAQGLAECEASCMHAPCCWADPKTNSVHYSCHDKAPSICTFYDVCLQLHTLSALAVPPAPASLAKDCSVQSLETYHGYTKCDDGCMLAPCCWGDAESPIGSCIGTHPQICQGYINCHELHSATSKAVEAAPSSIDQDCSKESLKTSNGLSKCEQTCMQAPCCWAASDGYHYSCRAKYSAACETYNPCMQLRHVDHTAETHDSVSSNTAAASPTNSGTTVTPASTSTSAPAGGSTSVDVAPSYISTACTEMINGDEVHGYLCELACRKAECCWNPATTSCGTDPNCGGYTICGGISFGPAMSNAVENPAPDKEWISNACQRKSLECVRVCTGTECCFDKTASTCSADCDKHSACMVLHEKDDAPTSSPNSNGSTSAPGSSASAQTTPAKYSMEMISDACLNHDNSIVNLCEKVCTGSECCFSDDPTSATCSLECGNYAACETLHKTTDDNAVTKACNTGDLADCVEACGTSSCCFTSDPTKSCAETGADIICAEYKACEKLYRGEQ